MQRYTALIALLLSICQQNYPLRALDSVKRDEADATVVAGFNNQLQTLQRQASALEATLAAAPWLTQLALTS
jgi:BMFP domain-containing protein YqiC